MSNRINFQIKWISISLLVSNAWENGQKQQTIMSTNLNSVTLTFTLQEGKYKADGRPLQLSVDLNWLGLFRGKHNYQMGRRGSNCFSCGWKRKQRRPSPLSLKVPIYGPVKVARRIPSFETLTLRFYPPLSIVILFEEIFNLDDKNDTEAHSRSETDY